MYRRLNEATAGDHLWHRDQPSGRVRLDSSPLCGDRNAQEGMDVVGKGQRLTGVQYYSLIELMHKLYRLAIASVCKLRNRPFQIASGFAA